MAFAVAVDDLVSPAVYSVFASRSEPPPLGVVTSIVPTVVAWQDGTETTYTPSTGPSAPDAGLSKILLNLTSPFLNKRVRGNGVIPFPNLDGRGNGVAVQVVLVTNFNVTALETAIVRFDSNGLYVAIPTAALEVVPGV
jgi:hypothetical protein